jgi:hypothetical protein
MRPQGHFQFDQLRGAVGQFQPSLLMSLVSELRSLNLLHVQEPAIKTPRLWQLSD